MNLSERPVEPKAGSRRESTPLSGGELLSAISTRIVAIMREH